MKTIILPGYSAHNKDWAEEIKSEINLGHTVIVHHYRHWGKGEGLSFSLRVELEKILEEVGSDKINIIAKSVGVLVTLNLIPRIPNQVKKIILCGIASVVSEDRRDLLKEALPKIPPEKFLCIQNENDKYVAFTEAKKFYHSVEPRLKVLSKPRSDHHYPYLLEFEKFLLSR